MATLNILKRTGKRPYRRVGRGQGSKRGKTSGKGGKGQTARAGSKIRPELRDIIKKLPKRRGYGKNRGRTHVPHPEPIALSLEKIAKAFDGGAEVSMATLIAKNVIENKKRPVKVVAGELDKKLSFKGLAFTSSAKAAVEKAGGSIASD